MKTVFVITLLIAVLSIFAADSTNSVLQSTNSARAVMHSAGGGTIVTNIINGKRHRQFVRQSPGGKTNVVIYSTPILTNK